MGIPAKTVERIQLPDLRRPERMPSLPAWVASRVESMSVEHQPDQVTGKLRMGPTLPGSLILSQAERDEIARHVRELDTLCGPTPADDPEVEGAMLVALTKLMLAPLAAANHNEASAAACGDAYLIALDDLPVWAVQSAIRRWYRGDGGKDDRGQRRDCHWRPAPADLRELATIELWRVKGRVTTLRDLLRAEPRIEHSDEHCGVMLARLSNLMHETFGIPLVG